MATVIEYNIKVNEGNSLSTIGQLEDELAKVNEELRDVDVNSEAFTQLSNKSQILTRDITNLNSKVEGMTLERKIQAADGAIKVMTGTISGVVGAFAALGVESEVLDQVERQVLGVIAFGSGMKDIVEGAGQLVTALRGATVAQELFNVATYKNPYVIAGAVIASALFAIVDHASKLTNGIVDRWNTFLNFFKSGGDYIRFQSLQYKEMAVNMAAMNKEVKDEDAQKAKQKEIEDLKDQIALYGTEGSESGLIALKIKLAKLNVQETEDYKAKRAALRELYTLQLEYNDAIAGEVREKQVKVETDTKGVKLANVEIKTSNEQIKVQDKKTKAKEYEMSAEEALQETAALGVSLLGENTVAGKALAIAQATFDTYKAANTALGSAPPPFNFALAAAVTAAGLANIKGIFDTQVPGEAGGGTMPQINPRMQAIQTLNVPQGFDTTGAAQAQPTQPMRAYVLTGDVTTGTEAQAKLNSKRSLG